jgi:hypothetical protein
MSHFDYEVSKQIAKTDPPFSALIMAAMRKADSGNVFKLVFLFPDTYAELQARYNAPGGVLPSDPGGHVMTAVREFVPVTEVMDHIRAHPEEHDQKYWICGTRACVAGRADLLAGYAPSEGTWWNDSYETNMVRHPNTGEEFHVRDKAAELMQLTCMEADALFHTDNDLVLLEQVTARIVARQRAAGILPAPGGAS